MAARAEVLAEIRSSAVVIERLLWSYRYHSKTIQFHDGYSIMILLTHV